MGLLARSIIHLVGLSNHPAEESYIWNMTNWWLFSYRRALVEYFIMLISFVTQQIPILNWILNLIPLGLSYVNLLVF